MKIKLSTLKAWLQIISAILNITHIAKVTIIIYSWDSNFDVCYFPHNNQSITVQNMAQCNIFQYLISVYWEQLTKKYCNEPFIYTFDKEAESCQCLSLFYVNNQAHDREFLDLPCLTSRFQYSVERMYLTIVEHNYLRFQKVWKIKKGQFQPINGPKTVSYYIKYSFLKNLSAVQNLYQKSLT